MKLKLQKKMEQESKIQLFYFMNACNSIWIIVQCMYHCWICSSMDIHFRTTEVQLSIVQQSTIREPFFKYKINILFWWKKKEYLSSHKAPCAPPGVRRVALYAIAIHYT